MDSWARLVLGRRCPEGKEASTSTDSPQALQRMSQTEEMRGRDVLGRHSPGMGTSTPAMPLGTQVACTS